MERRVARRSLLVGAATVAVAGCTIGEGDDGAGDGSGDGDKPAACPTTQELDVDWPDELTAGTVAEFVEAYDAAYTREVLVDYEPDSRLDAYRVSGRSKGDPVERDDGFVVETVGGGGVYDPRLHLDAAVAEAPADAERVSHEAVDDGSLRDLLEAAVDAEGEDDPSTRWGVGTGDRIDVVLEDLESLFDSFDPLDGPNQEATLYFDVDGTDVELTVASDGFHGDYGWRATYYVDERVVRRTHEEDTDPRDGELLECREAD